MPAWTELENNTHKSWWRDPGLRKMMLATTTAYFGAFGLGYDQAYLTALQALPSWQFFFGFPTGSELGLIVSCAYLPALVLLPVFVLFVNKFGRRPAALIGSLLAFGGAFVGAYAKDRGMFMAGRCIVGAGTILASLGIVVLLPELLHPRLRSLGTAFILVFMSLGSTVSAWVVYSVVEQGLFFAERSWRLPTLLQIVGPIPVILGIIFLLPESPRWLIAHGKREQALRVLAKYHANGEEDDPLVLWEMHEIESAIQKEEVERQGPSAFFKTKGNLRRFLIIMVTSTGSQANGVSLFTYYLVPALQLAGVTAPAKLLQIVGGLNIYAMGWAAIAATQVEKMGRRKLFLVSTGGLTLAFAVLTACSARFDATHDRSWSIATIAFIFISYAFYVVGWAPCTVLYASEVLPYSMRAAGIGIFFWAQQATLVANQWVNPIGLDAIGWKYYLVFVAALVIYIAAIYACFVETKGLSLEEVAFLFDGNQDASLKARKEAADAEAKYSVSTEHIEDVKNYTDTDSV